MVVKGNLRLKNRIDSWMYLICGVEEPYWFIAGERSSDVEVWKPITISLIWGMYMITFIETWVTVMNPFVWDMQRSKSASLSKHNISRRLKNLLIWFLYQGFSVCNGIQWSFHVNRKVRIKTRELSDSCFPKRFVWLCNCIII